MIKLDKLHINFRYLDGFKKLYNLVFCERDAGKTQQLEYVKFYKEIKKGYRVVILKRKKEDIASTTLNNICNRINQYLPINSQIELKGTGYDTGICWITMKQNKLKYKNCACLIWLKKDEQDLKSLCLQRVRNVIMDEYIVNPVTGEHYINGEMQKIECLIGTLNKYKENARLRVYLCGNPYTKYTPFCLNKNIDTNKLLPGKTLKGNDYIIWCYRIKEKLKEYLLKNNPLYEYNDEYKNFALNGVYINDKKINIITNLNHFKLYTVLYYNDKYLGIWLNHSINKNILYAVNILDNQTVNTTKKRFYCFQLYDVNKKCVLIDKDNNYIFNFLRQALRSGKVGFLRAECFHLINEIFNDYFKTI